MGFWSAVGKGLLSRILGGGGKKKEKQMAPEMKGTDVKAEKTEKTETKEGSGFAGKAGEKAGSMIASRLMSRRGKKQVSESPDLMKRRGFKGGFS